MPGRDTRTRFAGVYARHQERCRVSAGAAPGACSCRPSYWASVWDRAARRHRKTRRFARIAEARAARDDLAASLREGRLAPAGGLQLAEAAERFCEAAAAGVALNKHGRRYRPSAVADLQSSLRALPEWLARRRLGDVRRGDVQRMIDEKVAAGLSGSRIRSLANALRALYRWAQDRELAGHDPAQRVRLPAMAPKLRARVASPAELERLLEVLALDDALPWALAAYATARAQEIRALDWRDVDFAAGAVELAASEDARKSASSRRVVPLLAPLRALLRRAWIAQGRPAGGRVCPPRRRSASGMVSLNQLQKSVHRAWREAGLEPLGLHEARHTAATWLDHAGVSPKVASQLMGHATPERQPGAAPITLARYTHTLPGELERARELLDAFLAERTEAVAR